MFECIGGTLSAIVFLTAGATKFITGAWVVILAVVLFTLMALRIRCHYDRVSEALKLRPSTVEIPRHMLAPMQGAQAGQKNGVQAQDNEAAEETPEEIHHLTLVPIAALDRASMRAMAYAASLQQPVLVLHLSPTEKGAERFRS